jgi:putative transposase
VQFNNAGFVLDALEQAIHDRKPVLGGGLVHHSDRGVQYVSIKYTERLAEAGLVPSVGSVGDSYDNALAETIKGLYKAELIHRRGPWRSLEAVEYATLEWVHWFNNRRLLEPSETSHPPRQKPPTTQPWRNPPNSPPDSNQTASEKVGAVHTFNIAIPGASPRPTIRVSCLALSASPTHAPRRSEMSHGARRLIVFHLSHCAMLA